LFHLEVAHNNKYNWSAVVAQLILHWITDQTVHSSNPAAVGQEDKMEKKKRIWKLSKSLKTLRFSHVRFDRPIHGWYSQNCFQIFFSLLGRGELSQNTPDWLI